MGGVIRIGIPMSRRYKGVSQAFAGGVLCLGGKIIGLSEGWMKRQVSRGGEACHFGKVPAGRITQLTYIAERNKYRLIPDALVF